MKRPQHLSRKGAEFIARWEGFRSTAYNDAANNATIGYGHLLHMGPMTPADRHLVWTRDRALTQLQHDAERAAAAVRKVTPPFISQARFDAITSAVFNLGTGVLDRSRSLGRAVNRRSRFGTGSALMKYVYADGRQLPGLVARRKAERKLFRTGRYS